MATLTRMQKIHLKPEDLVGAGVPPMHFCWGAKPTNSVTHVSLVWELHEASERPLQERLPHDSPTGPRPPA